MRSTTSPKDMPGPTRPLFPPGRTCLVLSERLQPYRYAWPGDDDLRGDPRWLREDGDLVRNLPEDRGEVALDSRWPSFFPSPTCFVTTGDGQVSALEKVVGPSV